MPDDGTNLEQRVASAEARLLVLTEWRDQAAPAVSRLISDQHWRDDRIMRRTRAWKIWGLRLGAIVAGIAIVSSLVRLIETGVRVLGLS